MASELDRKAIANLNLVDTAPPQTQKREEEWQEVKKKIKEPKTSEGTSGLPAAPSRSTPPSRPAVKKSTTRAPAIPASQVRTAVSKWLANPRPELKPGITPRKREQLAFTHGEELHEALKKR